MKKYQKILMLSILIMSSAQGGVIEASEVFLDTKEDQVQITSSSEKNVIEDSGFNTNDLEIADDKGLPPESSNENSGSKDESSSKVDSEAEKSSSSENENVIEGKTTEKPKKADGMEEASKKGTFQKSLSGKNLPKVLVRLKQLPVKNSGSPFRDTSRSIFKNHINWIYSRGITTGYTPTTYNPEAKVTRGEMAVFLYRLAGAPAYNPPFNVYTDVSQYKNQILWLTAANISNGTAPYYNPKGKVTRGQMAAFLHRMAKVSGKAPVSGKYNPRFWDVKDSMFKNDIGWLSSKGITTGYTPTSFNPDADITRGEMAAFLYRFYNVTVNNQKLPPAPQPYANQPVYYSQLDSRWKNIRLNASNVGVSGCVPTSLAMILRGSYGMNVDPGIVAKKADTISRESFGLSGRDLINTAKSYGRSVEVIHTKERAASLLKAGYPLVFYINVGIGHAVVVSDYNNGLVNVNDPYGRLFYPTGKTSLNELWGRPSQDAMDWNAGRPVFAVK
ncbi:MAG TPA: hypothetical protein DCZ00_04490 [Lactococcus sp.]|uniref:S-layer homology domain-containing protein n=2 Tax=Streptococcaceae TaxID=1300 RepID=UPI000E838D9F|nr:MULTISPECIES: S-layer homology domain-containing protein [Lactococcus]HBC90687.1 hypothetical protein [Lactococcus sp.]